MRKQASILTTEDKLFRMESISTLKEPSNLKKKKRIFPIGKGNRFKIPAFLHKNFKGIFDQRKTL
jgi:hypothetical protein